MVAPAVQGIELFNIADHSIARELPL